MGLIPDTSDHLKLLWTDQCTISGKDKVTDPVTKITSFINKQLVGNEPCRISFAKTNNAANGSGVAAGISQDIKLFIRKDLVIPPGSKISVIRDGVTVDYKQSGQPAVFTSHQEISLNLFKEMA